MAEIDPAPAGPSDPAGGHSLGLHPIPLEGNCSARFLCSKDGDGCLDIEISLNAETLSFEEANQLLEVWAVRLLLQQGNLEQGQFSREFGIDWDSLIQFQPPPRRLAD